MTTPDTQAVRYAEAAAVTAAAAVLFIWINTKAATAFLKAVSYFTMLIFMSLTIVFVVLFLIGWL